MILVIGGAYQGKLTWAKAHFALRDEDCCDLAEGFLPGKRCYYHLEAATRQGEMPQFPEDAVIIAREVGCGVVPMDANERVWRERHGAALQELARQSVSVYRVFCGIGERMK